MSSAYRNFDDEPRAGDVDIRDGGISPELQQASYPESVSVSGTTGAKQATKKP